MTESGDGVVVQVDVRHLDVFRHRGNINGEAMIVGSYFHFAGGQVFDRLVAAAVPELHFESFPAERLPQDLVPQTDSEHRHVRFRELFYLVDDIPH